MSKLARTPAEVSNALDWAINSGPVMSGRVDAVAHVGKLIQGEYTPEFLTDVQAQNLDVLDGADPGYVRGYTEAWNALVALTSGVAIDELHRLT